MAWDKMAEKSLPVQYTKTTITGCLAIVVC